MRLMRRFFAVGLVFVAFALTIAAQENEPQGKVCKVTDTTFSVVIGTSGRTLAEAKFVCRGDKHKHTVFVPSSMDIRSKPKRVRVRFDVDGSGGETPVLLGFQ